MKLAARGLTSTDEHLHTYCVVRALPTSGRKAVGGESVYLKTSVYTSVSWAGEPYL